MALSCDGAIDQHSRPDPDSGIPSNTIRQAPHFFISTR
jgi:hypothetical protein